MVLRLAVFRCLTSDGMHQRAVVKRLKLSRSAVRRAIDFLLSEQAIESDSAPVQQGAVSFFRRGPKAADFEGWAGGPVGRGVAPHPTGLRADRPGLAIDPHRGTVRLPVVGIPQEPAKLPGFEKYQAPSGAKCWWFHFADPAGNVWSAQLNTHKGDKTGTLQITAPTIRTRDLAAALDAEGKKAVAQKEAIRWGQPFGLEVARGREAAVQVQPAEFSIPGLGLKPGIGTAGVDRAWTDPSQGRGSAETQDPAIVRAIGSLPEDMQAIFAHLRGVQHEFPQLREAVRQIVAMAEEGLALQGLVARGLAAVVAQQSNLSLPSKPPSLSPDSGVDVS